MLKVSKSRLPIVHTLNTKVYQQEKVGEKVGENRDKFYLSPTVCQHVCRVKAALERHAFSQTQDLFGLIDSLT